MRLVDIHVNKGDITGETHIVSFQMTAENTVVETRHEKKRRHTRFGNACYAHVRAKEAVEKEVKVIENEVEFVVFEEKSLAMLIVDEKILTQVPYEDSFEYVDGDYGKNDA